MSTPPLQPTISPSPEQTIPKPFEISKDSLTDLPRDFHNDFSRTPHDKDLKDSYKDSHKDLTRESHKKDPKDPLTDSYKESLREPHKDISETLPHIELKLPKRPVRERLGTREELKKIQEIKETEKRIESPERLLM